MLKWSLLLSLCVIFSFVVGSSTKEVELGGESFSYKSSFLSEKTVLAAAEQFGVFYSSSFTYIPYSANRIVISSNWPSNLLDVSLWVGYGIYLTMIFLFPFVVLILLCNVASFLWCCRKCGKCGGSEPKDAMKGYNKRSRTLLLIPIDIVFIIISLLTIVALVFMVLFSGNMTTISNDTFNSVDTALRVFDSISNLTHSLGPTVNSSIEQANSIINYLPQLNSPLNIINIDIQNAVNSVNSIQDDLNKINVSSIIARDKLYWLEQRNDISNVPSTSVIPSPSTDNSEIIDSAIKQLQNTDAQVKSASNLLSNSTNKFSDQIDSAQNTADVLVNTANGFIDRVNELLQKYFSNTTESSIVKYTNMGETILAIIICIALSWVAILYIITLGIIHICKKETKCCLQTSSCLTYWFAWTMFLLGSLFIIVWFSTTDVCNNFEPTAYNVLNNSLISINNISIADSAMNILKCSGNQDILSIIGLSINGTLNLQSYKNQLTKMLEEELNNFDINITINTARNGINEFVNKTNSFNLNYDKQIDNALAQMANLTAQLSDYSRFNFSFSEYQASLNYLNNYTYGISGAIYSFENVSTLNPFQPPYNSSLNVTQEVSRRKQAVLKEQSDYNTTIATIADISANISVINSSLIDIRNNLTEARYQQNEISSTYPKLLSGELDDFVYLMNNLTNNITLISNGVFAFLDGTYDTLQGILSCGWIGAYYLNTKTMVCTKMTLYIAISGICTILIGVLMFVMFPLLLIGTKRFGYKDINGEEQSNWLTDEVIPPDVIVPEYAVHI